MARRGGTRAGDFAKQREAIKGPGADTRYWVSLGTVGVQKDDGTVDATDPQAVVITPRGVFVDVFLQPLGAWVTARLQLGVGGRSCSIMAPIRAGDEVVVVLADGGLVTPVIVAILNNATGKLPLEQSDNKPVFRNDRLSIFAKDVPVEIRTASGARAILKTDGEVVIEPAAGKLVKIGSDTAPLQFAGLGDAIEEYLGEIKSAFNGHTHPIPIPSGAPIGVTSPTASTITGVVPVKSSNVKIKV